MTFTEAQLRRFREAIARMRGLGLPEALDRALDHCDEAICAYQSGLLDDDELHRELLRAGTVVRENEVWLLDLARICWQQWDGVQLQSTPGS